MSCLSYQPLSFIHLTEGHFKDLYFWANKDKIFSHRAPLSPSAPLLHVVFCSPDVQHIVATDQHLSQVSSAGAVDELLGVGQLQVHVAVRGDQEALVLMSPLQLDHDR